MEASTILLVGAATFDMIAAEGFGQKKIALGLRIVFFCHFILVHLLALGFIFLELMHGTPFCTASRRESLWNLVTCHFNMQHLKQNPCNS